MKSILPHAAQARTTDANGSNDPTTPTEDTAAVTIRYEPSIHTPVSATPQGRRSNKLPCDPIRQPSIRELVLQALRPPSRKWKDTHTGGVFALLMAAVAALLECRHLLDDDVAPNGRRPGSWSPSTLYGQFVDSLDERGILDRRHSEAIRMWSADCLLNNAQNNIAAGLDRCVNAWLGTMAGFDWDTLPGSPAEAELYLWIPTRLARIQREGMLRSDRIARLLHGFSAYPSTSKARQAIRAWARDVELRNAASSITDLVSNCPYAPEACIAIVFCRVNAFKHSVFEVPDRSNVEYLVETAISVRAAIGVATIWKVMIDEIENEPARNVRQLVS